MSTQNDELSAELAALVKRREAAAYFKGLIAGISLGLVIGLVIFLFTASKNGAI